MSTILITTITFIVLAVFALVLFLLWKQRRSSNGNLTLEPDDRSASLEKIIQENKVIIKKTQTKYHSRAADEPPDGNQKRGADNFDHKSQREEIMVVHSQRGDIIEPPSKRQQASHGQGMGMPAHPLTSVGPQGTALSLSTDASINPDAKANADAHPENTPVPTAELHNQAKNQISMAPTPTSPGG